MGGLGRGINRVERFRGVIEPENRGKHKGNFLTCKTLSKWLRALEKSPDVCQYCFVESVFSTNPNVGGGSGGFTNAKCTLIRV